jgi:pimeloyl-[acyl-carrier protein] methyl ester esterase
MSLYSATFGSGKRVILIHGWAMHSGIWRDFAGQLAQNYQVTCVDLPGHGHSGKLTPFTLEHITDALMAALPDEPCCVLGWSLGAAVALELARRFPERVSGVILVAGNPCFLQRDNWAGMQTAVLDSFAAHLQANTQMTLVRFLSIQVMTLPNAKALAKTLKTAVLECAAPDAQTLQGGLDILKDSDLRTTLAGVNVPVLVVLGKKDSLVPVAVGSQITRLAPTAQVHILEHAAHIPFLSHPQEVLGLVTQFMDNDVVG